MRILLFLLVACGGLAHGQSYTEFSGTIKNHKDSLLIRGHQSLKTIKINSDGTFYEKFQVKPGIYDVSNGTGYFPLYLRPGQKLRVIMDALDYKSTIFEGDAAKENNFLVQDILRKGKCYQELKTIEDNPYAYNKLVQEKLRIDDRAVKDKSYEPVFRGLLMKAQKTENYLIKSKAERGLKAARLKGEDSPDFAFKDNQGNLVRLKDFQGKYIFIDVWTTWCGPCIQESPHLNDLVEKYKESNIAFVSISLDKKADHEKWKKMVEHADGIVHLFADNSWKSKFVTEYGINAVPRFIIIDPEGRVVDADAKRPSEAALGTQLDTLLK